MSYDVVALVHGAPDVQSVVSQMIAGGERVRLVPADPAVHLCGEDDRPMVSVEEPQYIQVPGEIERLVGPETAAQAGTPVWWVEVRAASAVEGASEVARRFAEQIVETSGGVLWAPAAADAAPGVVPGEEPVDTPEPPDARSAGLDPEDEPEPEPIPPPEEDAPVVSGDPYADPPAPADGTDPEGSRP